VRRAKLLSGGWNVCGAANGRKGSGCCVAAAGGCLLGGGSLRSTHHGLLTDSIIKIYFYELVSVGKDGFLLS
jgi:hypothetical protein